MNIEYINPFVEASYEILSEVLQVEIKRGELYLKENVSSIKGVGVIVGLIGEAEGRLILDMNEKTACEIASIMNGEKYTKVDEIVKDTISEVSNMITALSITKLHDKGFNFDLTPPSIISGKEVEVRDKDLETLVVPLILPFGTVEINIAIKEEF
ncbi:MAG: chemotaxis protein CheX [Spirochaetes bacterium]|nr:chemotaxis protein CheX [Spirochaetota bacterium]